MVAGGQGTSCSSMSPDRETRVVVVGCGAVARQSLVPVITGHPRISIAALVDRDLERARSLAQVYGVARAETNINAIGPGDADAVVLATPPAHHANGTIAALQRGLHVFVEKPMATNLADAEAMVDAADAAQRVLSVGLYRRLLPAARLLQALIESGFLGRPLSVDIEEGGEYRWQLAGLEVLTRKGGGGGVLIDIGTHVLDQMRFVMPGPTSLFRYEDNARGGIETDCVLQFSIDRESGDIPCRVELSRTRQLRNSVRVECENGTFELKRADFCKVLVWPRQTQLADPLDGQVKPIEMAATWEDQQDMVGYQAFRAEIDDWLDAIATGAAPELSGRSALPTVELIERCYAERQFMPEPWTDERGAPALVTRRPRRVLVTGAGGFLGCRAAEILHEREGVAVRALVRRPQSAARLARLPIEITIGDVCRAEDMRRAVEGCEAVLHCAVGTDWPPKAAFRVTVEGTRQIAAAARAAGVARFVHISSMAVYGEQPPERIDEKTPLLPGTGFGYTRAKVLAEQAVLEHAVQGLATVILRPSRIYGPYSKTFVVRPLEGLRGPGLVLNGDASSPANMIYVDNVVEAMVRALDVPLDGPSLTLLLNDEEQLSWEAFYGFFADATGTKVGVVDTVPAGQPGRPGLIERYVGSTVSLARSPEMRALAKRVLKSHPLGAIPRYLLERSPALERWAIRAAGAEPAVVYRGKPPAAMVAPVTFRIRPSVLHIENSTLALGPYSRVRQRRALDLTLTWAQYARLA